MPADQSHDAMSDTTQQSDALTLEQALQEAMTAHQAGRLQDAERLYRIILQADPRHPDANHNLGVLAVQVRQPTASLPHFKLALEVNPRQGQYWLSYLDALIQSGQSDVARQLLERGRGQGLQGDAVEAMAARLNTPSAEDIAALLEALKQARSEQAEILARSLTEKFPQYGAAWKFLGIALYVQGKDAQPAFEAAKKLLPEDVEIALSLGNILQDSGQLECAAETYRRALTIRPDYVPVCIELGTTLRDLGHPDQAEELFRQALALNPKSAEAHNNLGKILLRQGRLAEAQVCFEHATGLNSNCAEAYNSLGCLLLSQGNPERASACYAKAINLSLGIIERPRESRRTREGREAFINSIRNLQLGNSPVPLRNALVKALSDPWCRPDQLLNACCSLAKLWPDLASMFARANAAWPQRLSTEDLYGSGGYESLVKDELLCAILEAGLINDIGLERFLTMVRGTLLTLATSSVTSTPSDVGSLRFHAALAQQCFINEYVFPLTSDESDRADALRIAASSLIDSDQQIPATLLLAVAAYYPLGSLPGANRLLDWEWPESVQAVLKQQISDPLSELGLDATIPRLTDIDDGVSILVRQQYEESPYPRWTRTTYAKSPMTARGFLKQRYPLSEFLPFDEREGLDILVAGCGTGRHPVETAMHFRGARILAIDISRASLCYAKRKTQECHLTIVEYAQADILKLENLGRSFDIIETAGVLHHLADPWRGWGVLLSILKPGGLMMVGLYSEIARRSVVKARKFIAAGRYQSTVDDIRRLRQDLVDIDRREDFGNISKSPDFFSASSCRDLLLHVQEHRVTLGEIDDFLSANNLVFLGFEIGPMIQQSYVRRFPEDHACTDLKNWAIFESENPNTFSGMYQFWVQKKT